MDRERTTGELGFDIAIGLLVTGLAYVVPALGLTLMIPGFVVAFTLQAVARALGTGVGTFDNDEMPGPAAMAIGVVANVLVWALVTRGARWLASRVGR